MTKNHHAARQLLWPGSFSYQAGDGKLLSNIATVSLNVKPVNDAPTFTSTAPTTHTLVANTGTGTGADATGVYQVDASSTRLSFELIERKTSNENELMPGDAQ